MVDYLTNKVQKVQNTADRRRNEVLTDLVQHQEQKLLLLQTKAKLTNRSPITEARLRAVNKKIDECNKELLFLDELMKSFATDIRAHAEKTV